MQKANNTGGTPSFAGIALADILANGVAIILLMIIINLQVKSSAQVDLAEKVKDVSILLSRDIAKQVVMNALPTSPPARLHDYTRSQVDRFPKESIMPVLELTEDGVRDFYSGNIWHRNSLFLTNNALDQYLSSLYFFQKKNLRVDVYAVKNFYLLMSILKDHDIAIKHWHFIGESTGGYYEGRQLPDNSSSLAMNKSTNHALNKKKKVLTGELPEGTVLKKSHAMMGGDSQAYTQVSQNQVFSPLAATARVQSGEVAVSSDIRHTLKIAEETKSAGSTHVNLTPIKDYRNTLAFLFDFLIRMQNLSDEGYFGVLREHSLADEMMRYVYSFPKLSEYRAFMVEKIYDEMAKVPDDNVKIYVEESSNVAGIKVDLNKRINWVEVVGAAENISDGEPSDVQVQLSLYPGIFKSISVSITENSIILMPVENNDQPLFKWHLVTMIDLALGQSYIGFLYSDVDENNHLFIQAANNSVLINQQALALPQQLDGNRKNKRLFVLYAFIVLLVVALIFKRKRS